VAGGKGASTNCPSDGCGMVFKITPGGVETVLYSFGISAGDGVLPEARLIQGADGNFYGTTAHGGAGAADTLCSNDCGTVFKLTPAGVETVLYSFGSSGNSDGFNPAGLGLVQGSDGNFYGTTSQGGSVTNCEGGCGTVYKITPAGVESVLHSFGGSGSSDGASPIGIVLGSDGNFYGTTSSGGKGTPGTNCSVGCGTFFKITTAGVETVLYSFGSNGNSDGANPSGVVQGSDANFYGTTSQGGTGTSCTGGCGTVFRSTSGGVETVLYSFGTSGSSDGSTPADGLVLGNDGNFYGTTAHGGASGNCSTYGCGTVFKITSGGEEAVLYSFAGTSGSGSNGSDPDSLVQSNDGTFYGTTFTGGTGGLGTFFKLIP